eukprot:6188921-Ditylum_brightwellii.AAC.1
MYVALDALSQLGVIFPKKISKLTHVKEIMKTKRKLKGLCIMGLSDHPMMEDGSKLLVMKMMEILLVITYTANPA